MQIDRSKPNAVGHVPLRPTPPSPSCERSPQAGVLPERAPVYRVVLGCSFASRRPRPEDRFTGTGERVRCA